MFESWFLMSCLNVINVIRCPGSVFQRLFHFLFQVDGLHFIIERFTVYLKYLSGFGFVKINLFQHP